MQKDTQELFCERILSKLIGNSPWAFEKIASHCKSFLTHEELITFFERFPHIFEIVNGCIHLKVNTNQFDVSMTIYHLIECITQHKGIIAVNQNLWHSNSCIRRERINI